MKFLQKFFEISGADLLCQAVDPVACADADGRRAADLQRMDGVPDLPGGGKTQIFQMPGKPGLVNDDNGVLVIA